jgi:hypothetical protein
MAAPAKTAMVGMGSAAPAGGGSAALDGTARPMNTSTIPTATTRPVDLRTAK